MDDSDCKSVIIRIATANDKDSTIALANVRSIAGIDMARPIFEGKEDVFLILI